MKEVGQIQKKFTQKILTIGLVWLSILFLMNTLFSSISNAFKDINYIQNEQKKLGEIQQKKIKLENELKYKQSQVYISNRALNDLGYTDPTAKIFFIKDETEPTSQTIELRTEILFPDDPNNERSNLNKWLEIFLK